MNSVKVPAMLPMIIRLMSAVSSVAIDAVSGSPTYAWNERRLRNATSTSPGLLVAAMTATLGEEPTPSMAVRNAFRAALTIAAFSSPALSALMSRLSTSSMKMMATARCPLLTTSSVLRFAHSKMPCMFFSVPPEYVDLSVAAGVLKKKTLLPEPEKACFSVFTAALTMNVLPVPGGPNNSMPRLDEPSRLYCSGYRKPSLIFSLTSWRPTTSSK